MDGDASPSHELTPESYWNAFADELNSAASDPEVNLWRDYNSDKAWTERVTQCAERVAERIEVPKLHSSREYFRLDHAAYSRVNENEWCNWHLRIAFEHENGDGWTDELCKLTQLHADLKVLISYIHFGSDQASSDAQAKNALEEACRRLENTGNRITRGHGAWLIAFGPRVRSMRRRGKTKLSICQAFKVFQIRCGGELVVEQLHDISRVHPCAWCPPELKEPSMCDLPLRAAVGS